MTSQQYIEKVLRGDAVRRTAFQSLCTTTEPDGAVTVYSYGLHYPLVKIINGKAFINDAGYSATTSKHIGWAWAAAASIVGWHNCYHAPLIRGSQLTLSDIHDNAIANQETINQEMAMKKRTDTQVYAWLQTKFDRMQKTIEAVERDMVIVW